MASITSIGQESKDMIFADPNVPNYISALKYALGLEEDKLPSLDQRFKMFYSYGEVKNDQEFLKNIIECAKNKKLCSPDLLEKLRSIYNKTKLPPSSRVWPRQRLSILTAPSKLSDESREALMNVGMRGLEPNVLSYSGPRMAEGVLPFSLPSYLSTRIPRPKTRCPIHDPYCMYERKE